MSKDTTINAFLAQRTLAVVGVSRGGKKFGNSVYHDLKNKGYRVFPVNPHAGSIAGERCYPDLLALPEHVGGAVLVIPPALQSFMPGMPGTPRLPAMSCATPRSIR